LKTFIEVNVDRVGNLKIRIRFLRSSDFNVFADFPEFQFSGFFCTSCGLQSDMKETEALFGIGLAKAAMQHHILLIHK
jgi:hypothetical protein